MKEEISEYEKLREQNILESQRLMQALGVEEVSKSLLLEIRPEKRKPGPRRKVKKKQTVQLTPTRRSARLQAIATGEKPKSLSENDLMLFYTPPVPEEKRPAGTLIFSEVVNISDAEAEEEEEEETKDDAEEEDKEAKAEKRKDMENRVAAKLVDHFLTAFRDETWRMDSVPLSKLAKTGSRRRQREISRSPESRKAIKLQDGVKLPSGSSFSEGLTIGNWSPTFSDAAKSDCLSQITQLQYRDRRKVCQSRIYSVIFYPSKSAMMLIVGDRDGYLGFSRLTNYTKDVSESPVWKFRPHIRPINGLTVSEEDGGVLYTCSYDGSARLMDIDKGVFHEVFVDEDDLCKDIDLMAPKQLAIALSSGDVVLADCRERFDSYQTFHLNEARLRTVHFHPLQKQYFCTASTNGKAAIWDIRGKHAQPVTEMIHTKSVSSAYFSPMSGERILTASMDNRITVWDVKDLQVGPAKRFSFISHDNHVGRWLTNFRPVYHPLSDDIFISGSMHYPRRVEIFDGNCKMVHTLESSTVCSLNCFHPAGQAVAGANSSGYVAIWTGPAVK